VILGDANCGKTSLVTRFAQGYYHPNLNHRSKSAPNSPNHGGHTNTASPASSVLAQQHRNPNFVTKSIPVTASNIPTKIQIWDVAGSVPNNNNNNTTTNNNTISNKGAITAAKCYYSNASAILLGYDVTSRSSYDGMRSWLNELRSSSSTKTNNNSVSFNNVVIAIVALKIDLLDDYPYKGGEVVPEYEVEQLAQTLNVMYIPTSAKLDINVMSLFSRVAEEVLERRKQQREGSGSEGGGGYGLNGGTTLTGAATTSSTAYEKKGSDATNNNNGDNNNADNDHRDDYDDVTDKNGNDDDDGTNQFGKRKRSSSGCAPASAVFGMMGGRGKEEENGGNVDGNNNGNNDNMMEEDVDNDDDSLNDGEKKKKDDEDDDENTGSFFMMCGNTTWCGNTADTIDDTVEG
jgi:GTPase SAR1 family protein